jgi:hypothetical protein
MRPLRIDVTGTTDKAGNASIPVKLPVNGEWHDVKFALSTSGPAEWALLVSGTAITYGRGRRVTLGPELIQDGEQVTITVTGGPVLSPIIGSATGRSGDPDTITAQWGPQPNTIALDSAIPRQKLYPDGVPIPPLASTPSLTILSGGNATVRFTLPAGTVLLRILANASGIFFGYSLLVTGHQSGEQYFGDPNSPGTPLRVFTPTLPLTIPIEFDWDQQLDLTILYDAAAASGKFFMSALFAPEPPGQAGNSQAVNVLPGATIRPQRYDWFVNGRFTPGQTPSIVGGGGFVGILPVLAAYYAMLGSTGAVVVQEEDIAFTANPSGTAVWKSGLCTPAVAGQCAIASQEGLAAAGVAGDTITMSMNGALPANGFAIISMGGYYTTVGEG